MRTIETIKMAADYPYLQSERAAAFQFDVPRIRLILPNSPEPAVQHGAIPRHNRPQRSIHQHRSAAYEERRAAPIVTQEMPVIAYFLAIDGNTGLPFALKP